MTEQTVVLTQAKVPFRVHLMAGWPLMLILMGGAIGGAFAGLACNITAKLKWF